MKIFFCFAIICLVCAAQCTSSADDMERRAAAARERGSAATGAPAGIDGGAIFRRNCVVCHGADGKLGQNGAKNLTQSTLDVDARVSIITNGKGLMTPFKALLTPEEIKAVAEYTATLK
jgi:cytochrome c6